jgi:hypothetical protein
LSVQVVKSSWTKSKARPGKVKVKVTRGGNAAADPRRAEDSKGLDAGPLNKWLPRKVIGVSGFCSIGG